MFEKTAPLNAKIAGTMQAWKSGEDYEDVARFCKSATLAEIEKNGFVLTPGRFVGAILEQENQEPFGDKVTRLYKQLNGVPNCGQELDKKIHTNLQFFTEINND